MSVDLVIPTYSSLASARSSNFGLGMRPTSCTVIAQSEVQFEGERHSLSSAALIATNRMGFEWKSIAGPMNWKYEGEVLTDRRARLESSD